MDFDRTGWAVIGCLAYTGAAAAAGVIGALFFFAGKFVWGLFT